MTATQSDLTLNTQPSEKRLSHTNDPAPAKEAGQKQVASRSLLQGQIILEFRKHGPMTDDQLAHLFPQKAPSTIRGRRHELAVMGILVEGGTGQSAYGLDMTIWKLS